MRERHPPCALSGADVGDGCDSRLLLFKDGLDVRTYIVDIGDRLPVCVLLCRH